MSKIDDYVAIILTSNMSENEKISYLRVLNSIRNFSEEQLQDLENKIYTLDKKTLSEKDRLIYEINYLYEYYKNRNMDLSNIRKLYYNLRSVGKNDNALKKIKSRITRLQLENNLKIRFYNSYLDLLEEIKKENLRKTERTFSK